MHSFHRETKAAQLKINHRTWLVLKYFTDLYFKGFQPGIHVPEEGRFKTLRRYITIYFCHRISDVDYQAINAQSLKLMHVGSCVICLFCSLDDIVKVQVTH